VKKDEPWKDRFIFSGANGLFYVLPEEIRKLVEGYEGILKYFGYEMHGRIRVTKRETGVSWLTGVRGEFEFKEVPEEKVKGFVRKLEEVAEVNVRKNEACRFIFESIRGPFCILPEQIRGVVEKYEKDLEFFRYMITGWMGTRKEAVKERGKKDWKAVVTGAFDFRFDVSQERREEFIRRFKEAAKVDVKEDNIPGRFTFESKEGAFCAPPQEVGEMVKEYEDNLRLFLWVITGRMNNK